MYGSYKYKSYSSYGCSEDHDRFSSYKTSFRDSSDDYYTSKPTPKTKKADRTANRQKKKTVEAPVPKYSNNTKVHVNASKNGETYEFNGLIIETVFPHTKSNHTDNMAYYIRSDEDYKVYLVNEDALSDYIVKITTPEPTPEPEPEIRITAAQPEQNGGCDIKVCHSSNADITIDEVEKLKIRVHDLEHCITMETRRTNKKVKKLAKLGLALAFGL